VTAITYHLCPVCGYPMEDPASDFNICPSCGTEFGLHDENSSIDNLRAVWVEGGYPWHSTVDQVPENWNAVQQLSRLLRFLSLNSVSAVCNTRRIRRKRATRHRPYRAPAAISVGGYAMSAQGEGM
jgi:hypothetical protein